MGLHVRGLLENEITFLALIFRLRITVFCARKRKAPRATNAGAMIETTSKRKSVPMQKFIPTAPTENKATFFEPTAPLAPRVLSMDGAREILFAIAKATHNLCEVNTHRAVALARRTNPAAQDRHIYALENAGLVTMIHARGNNPAKLMLTDAGWAEINQKKPIWMA